MHLMFNSLRSLYDYIKPIKVSQDIVSYTWFGRSSAVHYGNKYWIGLVKDFEIGTTQFILEYDKTLDTYTYTRVGTEVSVKDDHDHCQILIRQDGKLMAFYSGHAGSLLRYKTSENIYDSKSWGSEKTLNPEGEYSYVSPYQSSNGTIYIFFRTQLSGQKWMYMKSIDNGENFSDPTVFFETGFKLYVVTEQDGDLIHFGSSDGHPQSNPALSVNIFHFYFDMISNTFFNSQGLTVSLPITQTNSTKVTNITGNDTSWILDIKLKNNLPRIIYIKYPSGKTTNLLKKELWYVEFNGVSWINNTFISTTRTGYVEDDLTIQEYGYSGASRFDSKNSDIIWMPKDVLGKLEIHKVDVSSVPPKIKQLTYKSEVDNWRPISVNFSKNNLLFLKKNQYNYYTQYDMNLMAATVKT